MRVVNSRVMERVKEVGVGLGLNAMDSVGA